jgi:hypothetical protein
MLAWLKRNSAALSALGGLTAACAALVALFVIPYQIGQADLIQRDQTAREIYREFLNLTVQKPELAHADYCALKEASQITAYTAYVDYLLYTAEQMIDTSPTWKEPMARYLGNHLAYLCDDAGREMSAIRDMMAELGLQCTPANACQP